MVGTSALWYPSRNISKVPALSSSSYWRFWGTLLWSSLIIFLFCVTQILFTVIEILVSYHGGYSQVVFAAKFQSAAQNGTTVAYATLVSTVVCCSSIGGIITLKKGTTLKDYLCVYKVPIRQIALWFGIILIFGVFSNLILYSLGEPIIQKWLLDVYKTAQPVWVLWIAVVVAAPLSEELFFRGFMFKGFQSSFLGITGTIMATSGVWASFHIQYDLAVIIDIWCLGIILGMARQITGSILTPLCLHTLFNLWGTVWVAISHYLH
jgi:membrane protease YdiL (CAAX protease family)